MIGARLIGIGRQIAGTLKQHLLESLEALDSVSIDKLLEQRYQKLMAFGQYRET